MMAIVSIIVDGMIGIAGIANPIPIDQVIASQLSHDDFRIYASGYRNHPPVKK